MKSNEITKNILKSAFPHSCGGGHFSTKHHTVFWEKQKEFTTNSTWQFLISMLLVAVILQPWKEMVNFLMNLQWERTCTSSGPRILNHQLWRGISFQDSDTKRVRWLSSSVIFVAKGCRLKRWLRTTHFEDIPFLWINHGRKAMVHLCLRLVFFRLSKDLDPPWTFSTSNTRENHN